MTQASLWSICTYCVAAIFLKSSLAALYLRIFQPSKGARGIIYISIVPILIFYTVVLFVSIAKCVPTLAEGSNAETSPEDNDVSHISDTLEITQARTAAVDMLRDIGIAISIFSVITDFYFLILPAGLILNIQLPPKRKLGISLIFLTGLLYVTVAHETFGGIVADKK